MERKAIKVNRCPIKLPQNVKLHMKYQQVQLETKDDTIMSMIEHYNMLARKAKGITGYNAVSLKDPKSHRNWRYFELVYEACRMQEWDTNLYLDAQFHRYRDLGRIPYPHGMCSLNSFRYFTNFLSDIKQKYDKDTNKREKQKGKETLTVKQEVVSSIVSSVQLLSRSMGNTKVDNTTEFKVIKIFHSWAEMSPYYLWSIPWFHDALSELPSDNVDVQRVTKEFNTIRNSKSLQEVIKVSVAQAEEHFRIPPNMEIQ